MIEVSSTEYIAVDGVATTIETLKRQAYDEALEDFSKRAKQITYTSGSESEGYYSIHAICERDIDEIVEVLKK